jgi:hypothetical protein
MKAWVRLPVERRLAVTRQPPAGGASLQEVARAVQRIDAEEARADLRRAAGGGLLLREHRDVGGERGEALEDDGFGAPVGDGHGRAVGLALRAHARLAHLHDGAAGLKRERDERVERRLRTLAR